LQNHGNMSLARLGQSAQADLVSQHAQTGRL
jgi:hypothetical protein